MRLTDDTLTLARDGAGTLVSDDRIRPTLRFGWYVDRADPREDPDGRVGHRGSGRGHYALCMTALGHHAVYFGSSGASGGSFGDGGCPAPPR